MGGRIYIKSLLSVSFIALCVVAGQSNAGPISLKITHFDDICALHAECSEARFVSISDTASKKMGQGAQSFIEKMANRGIDFLSNESLSSAQKTSSFEKLLKDSFDMKTIGRFSLGRYWRSATAEQKKEYQKLFQNMILKVYSQRFSDYQGQKFEARSFRVDSEKDTLVLSYIIPDEGPEVEVEWRVRYKNGKYKVVDIIVEGVSMSVTQRSDFGSVIQRGGGNVQALLSYLRDENKKTR